jgi:hypothetical protein
LVAQCWIWGKSVEKMLSNWNKGEKGAGLCLGLNLLLGFRYSRDLFLYIFSMEN